MYQNEVTHTNNVGYMTSRKRNAPCPTWSIVFEDAAPLKLIVDTVSNVMGRVSFKVEKAANCDYFLTVDSADVAVACVVSARLRLDKVTFPNDDDDDSEFSFCLDCKHISTVIEPSSCAHLALTMEGYSETGKVVLRFIDVDQHAHSMISELPTWVSEPPFPGLERLEFKMIVELDLALVREMIKTARKAHTEHLRIDIYLKEVGGKKISTVCFTLEGDWKTEQKFCHEVITDEDGSMKVRAATDGTEKLLDVEDTEPYYHGTFPVEKIYGFIHNLGCRMLTAKVMTDQPMMLRHYLSGASDDKSRIDFLIAPVNEDEP